MRENRTNASVLEIAMDDALFMRHLKGLGDLLRDGQRFIETRVSAFNTPHEH